MNDEVIMDEELDITSFPAVRNCYNAHLFPREYEKGGGVSLSIPDESMSVREILSRYARGIPFSGPMRNPVYDEDSVFPEGMPDLSQMDYTEVQELYDQLGAQIISIRSQLNDIQNAQNEPQEAVKVGG